MGMCVPYAQQTHVLYELISMHGERPLFPKKRFNNQLFTRWKYTGAHF